jgi:hypothetical protein
MVRDEYEILRPIGGLEAFRVLILLVLVRSAGTIALIEKPGEGQSTDLLILLDINQALNEVKRCVQSKQL